MNDEFTIERSQYINLRNSKNFSYGKQSLSSPVSTGELPFLALLCKMLLPMPAANTGGYQVLNFSSILALSAIHTIIHSYMERVVLKTGFKLMAVSYVPYYFKNNHQ